MLELHTDSRNYTHSHHKRARALIVFCSRARRVNFLHRRAHTPALCSAKFAGKSSRPLCIHSRRPVYVTVAPFKNHHRSRRFHGDRVLSCTNDCALSISRVKMISEVSHAAATNLERSNFADLTAFSRTDG